MRTPRKIYFLSEYHADKPLHGSIGNVDVERIFLELGFEMIQLPFHHDFSFRAKVLRLAFVLNLVRRLPDGAVFFFQHSVYAKLAALLLKLLTFRKQVTVVVIATEIDGLRFNDRLMLRNELRLLGRYKYFVAQTEIMRQFLKTSLKDVVVVVRHFVDFLAPCNTRLRHKSYEIAFAANLEKSPFLAKIDELRALNPSLRFNVYGPGFTAEIQRNKLISFGGVFPPDKMPQVVEGAFGLIWDGDELHTLSGHFGLYQHYNLPHKLSLYILAGLPIIVHENAAVAAEIRKHDIGITITSLFELERKIASISPERYHEMTENTRLLAKQISSGEMLKRSVKEILLKIDET